MVKEMQLILMEKAYRKIVEECFSFPEVETGGILIGRKVDRHNIVVPFALGSGPKARRSYTRFSPDVAWQQHALEKLFERYQINYIGSFHRHPGNYSQPSLLDYKTAIGILESPDWGISEAVFPILILKNKKVEFHPYHMSWKSKRFQPIDWQVVSNKKGPGRPAL